MVVPPPSIPSNRTCLCGNGNIIVVPPAGGRYRSTDLATLRIQNPPCAVLYLLMQRPTLVSNVHHIATERELIVRHPYPLTLEEFAGYGFVTSRWMA